MASNRWRWIVGAAGLVVLTIGSSPVLTWRVPVRGVHIMKMWLTCCSRGTLILLLTAGAAWAQATAQLSGTVRDSSGAVLPGVTVTVTQTDTGLVRTAVTDETGGYLLTNLPTGPYKLEVALQGFKTYVQTGIVL